MKIGIDVHGVIDKKPKLYSKLTKRLISLEHEVHIITGAQIKNKLLKQLQDFNISYTHIFSISDFHKKIGTPIIYKDSDNIMMDDVIWNKTKAIYCFENKIDLHIDDSSIYGKYFTNNTIYLQVKGC